MPVPAWTPWAVNGCCHASLSVASAEPPVIQPQPSEVDVTLNNPVLLPCDTAGTPSPLITWQKEGINAATSGACPVSTQGVLAHSVFYEASQERAVIEIKMPLCSSW